MKKNIQIILIIFFITQNLFSQNNKIETIFQKCFYYSIGEKSIGYRNQFKNFENDLIEKNILKNNSPNSYYKLLKSLNKNKTFLNRLEYNLDSLAFYVKEEEIISANRKCLKKVKKHKDYSLFKEKTAKSFNKKNDFWEGIKNAANTINIKDLELDYYKQRVLLNTELVFILSYGELSRKDFSHITDPFIIKINNEGELIYKGKKNESIQIHNALSIFLTHRKERASLILLKVSKNLEYGKYLKVLSNIEKLIESFKNDKAKLLFNLKYKKLNSKQKKRFDNKYDIILLNEEY